MLLETLIAAYEEKVPSSLALPSDRNGLKLGQTKQNVHKVFGCLELTRAVVEFAIASNVDCIFVHHDPFYIPLSNLRTDDAHSELILSLIRHDIALYVSHTNLDIVDNGLNDYIFQRLGGLEPHILDVTTGIGRLGSLAVALNLDAYIDTFVKPVQQNFRLITNNTKVSIQTFALVNGSGARMLPQAIDADVDLFITGDVDYHTAMSAREYNIPVIDIGHDIEYLVRDVFTNILTTIKAEHAARFIVIDAPLFDFCPW